MFSQRIQQREQLWWKTKHPNIHSKKYCHGLLTRDAPEAQWKCCPFWQRKLNNKWNGREFAARHGARLPQLYWSGRAADQMPFDELPSHYVVRSTSGSNKKGVLVMADGTSVYEQKSYDRSALKARLQQLLERGFSNTQLLVEEFVRNEAGAFKLPRDYKFDMFGDVIASILVINRGRDGRSEETTTTYYDADWKQLPFEVFTQLRQGPEQAPPACLDALKELARRLGRAHETYVRIDLFAGEDGPVFGEFSPTPGAGRCFTPEADRYFESFWCEHFPNAL